MTEITAKFVRIEISPIHAPAFCVALCLLPMLIRTLSIWGLFAPLAIFVVLSTYGVVGAPIFALACRFFGANLAAPALAGEAVNLAAYPPIALVFGAEIARGIAAAGVVIAPLWGLSFGLIYRSIVER